METLVMIARIVIMLASLVLSAVILQHYEQEGLTLFGVVVSILVVAGAFKWVDSWNYN